MQAEMHAGTRTGMHTKRGLKRRPMQTGAQTGIKAKMYVGTHVGIGRGPYVAPPERTVCPPSICRKKRAATPKGGRP